MTPLHMTNTIPARCKILCVAGRGDDAQHHEICGQFSPNPFKVITINPARFPKLSLDADTITRELCYDCEHIEECHR